LNYEQVYTWYIGKAIERLIDENVMYAELRPMLLDKSIPTDDGKRQITNAEQMRLIIKGVEDKKKELEKNGELHKFPFGLKIIYCTPRSIPKKMMQEEMRQCIDLKLQFPDLICGFDLVGAEDRPNHIGFYREELLAFQKTCDTIMLKGKKLEIPFLFHAGETLLDTGGSDDPRNSNLYDAALLNSKRIGHGFALMKHPQLVEEKFKRTPGVPGSGICVELCPISNELLHLCRNIKEHPYPELLAAGIPCTVNSDNPSLFSNSMSHEFYQIMVGAPTMSLYSWKQLARWSLEYSCLNDDEKSKGQEYLDASWKKFCSWVVTEFKDLMQDDGITIDNDKAAAAYEQTDQENKNQGMGRPTNNSSA
jgi:adenosine deaminase CECR1